MGEIRKVIIDGEEFEVDVDVDGEIYRATIEGETFEFKIPESKASGARMRTGGGGRKRSGTVSASMPGKVVTVEVSVGDSVEEGQTILILEAMKMQNELKSPKAGRINEINVVENQAVNNKDPLLIVE